MGINFAITNKFYWIGEITNMESMNNEGELYMEESGRQITLSVSGGVLLGILQKWDKLPSKRRE